MRIEALHAMTVGDRRRIEADVVFEDTERPPLRVYIEAGPPFSDALEPLPEAFVLPALPAAVWSGERRLRVEGALDPVLAMGLEQAMVVLKSWYAHCRPLVLEPSEGYRSLRPARAAHAAALCSGGLDSLAMLRENWLRFPQGDAASIRSLVYIFGYSAYEFSDGAPHPGRFTSFERNAERLETFADRFGLPLSRVHTNATLLYPDTVSYIDAGSSATLLAPLLALSRRVTEAHVASTGAGFLWTPHGSHPLLDGLYSTGATRVHLAQPLVPRHDKVGQIKDWEPAYEVLHPCLYDLDVPAGQVNCGACEKCMRTMLSLVAWGALDRFPAFPADDVTPDMILRAPQNQRAHYWEDPAVLGQLRARGRMDLIQAVRMRTARRDETRWARRRRRWRRSIRKRLGLSPYR